LWPLDPDRRDGTQLRWRWRQPQLRSLQRRWHVQSAQPLTKPLQLQSQLVLAQRIHGIQKQTHLETHDKAERIKTNDEADHETKHLKAHDETDDETEHPNISADHAALDQADLANDPAVDKTFDQADAANHSAQHKALDQADSSDHSAEHQAVHSHDPSIDAAGKCHLP